MENDDRILIDRLAIKKETQDIKEKINQILVEAKERHGFEFMIWRDKTLAYNDFKVSALIDAKKHRKR